MWIQTYIKNAFDKTLFTKKKEKLKLLGILMLTDTRLLV